MNLAAFPFLSIIFFSIITTTPSLSFSMLQRQCFRRLVQREVGAVARLTQTVQQSVPQQQETRRYYSLPTQRVVSSAAGGKARRRRHFPFASPPPPRHQQQTVRRMVQGVLVDDDNCIVNTNPATGEVIGRIQCTTSDELNHKLSLLKEGQRNWSTDYTVEQRIEYLRRALQELSTNADKKEELAQWITKEMGKPIQESRDEVGFGVDKQGDYLDKLQQTLMDQPRGDNCIVLRQPLGVVAVLSPWNFPCDEILLLVLPALASGNTVLVKPSEVTPQTGALVIQFLQAFLPDGGKHNILQLAQGDGRVGSQIVSHSAVNLIAMTGSTATGQKILQTAAPDFKRLVLELGGKDPMIVFDDADLEKAANDAVAYSLSNTGQVCCSVERIYVAESIFETFSQKVKQIASEFKVGNGLDPTVKVGPMVSAMQREIVQRQVTDAVEKGATILYQTPGEEMPKAAAPDVTTTNYFPVTVLSHVTDSMDIYREETFGPVVSLMAPFSGTEEDAIRLANDTTQYGLAASVYTRDVTGRAQRVARRIEAGQIGINCYALENLSVECPWVGHKQSGYGYHSGIEGFLQFSIPKTLAFAGGMGAAAGENK